MEATEQTAEGRMLQASRDEIEKRVDEDVHGIRRFRDTIVLFLDLYIWEPVCTGLRFLHLVVIFVPVILTVPALWVGRRSKERNNERRGTLWWYWFLVKSMERAGPAFIKVCIAIGLRIWLTVAVGTMGSFEIRYLSHANVRNHVTVTLERSGAFSRRNQEDNKESIRWQGIQRHI